MPKVLSSLEILTFILICGTHASWAFPREDTCPVTPWSYPPQCVKGYCVYTSASYNNDYGVSFIALSSEEETLRPLVHDSQLTERGKIHLSSSSALPYEIKEFPGRGRGVFARRFIPRGEVFMVTFPAVVVDQEFESWVRHQELYQLAYKRLGVPERALELAASSGGSVYEDILKTNAFGAGVGGRRYSGLYPEAAVRGFIMAMKTG